jgi:hypothetical protein
MVVNPAPVHGNIGQQIRHRLARGEWVRLGELVDLDEDVPGAGAVFLEKGCSLPLEFFVTVSGDDMHDPVAMGDRGLQLVATQICSKG